MSTELLFDFLVTAGLVILAGRILLTIHNFEAIVLFIAFGLLMALAWTRLAAPDIALAEAAVGAGLTGVLLLDTLWHISLTATDPLSDASPQRKYLTLKSLLTFASVLTLLALLLLTASETALERGGLVSQVRDTLHLSGVEHPVTAVLLNFRGYDTWLELGILMVAVIAVISMRGTVAVFSPQVNKEEHVVARWLVRCLLPLMVLSAAYLLWLGKFAAGGAFQAGVVLSAAFILVMLSGLIPFPERLQAVWRVVLIGGFAVFLTVALVLVSQGRALLQYPVAYSSTLILIIEISATFSIGATLAALFAGLQTTENIRQ